MSDIEGLDIYQRRARNRRRLAIALLVYALISLGVSSFCLYILSRVAHLGLNFWLLLSLFWAMILLFTITRFAVSGSRAFRKLATISADRHLQDAFEAAKLASGFEDKVRLYEIPDPGINAFSLSLPDRSYALVATQGVSSILPEREREALMAHEIAHMQVGDTIIHTLLLYLAGWPPVKKMARDETGPNPMTLGAVASVVGFFLWFTMTFMAAVESEDKTSSLSPAAFWPALACILLCFLLGFPIFMYKSLRIILDKEREYYADMEAVYLTRDPEAVYRALKHTAEDVIDVLLLPPCYDALLFKPLGPYSSYKPSSQPSMLERINHIKRIFPQVDPPENPGTRG